MKDAPQVGAFFMGRKVQSIVLWIMSRTLG